MYQLWRKPTASNHLVLLVFTAFPLIMLIDRSILQSYNYGWLTWLRFSDTIFFQQTFISHTSLWTKSLVNSSVIINIFCLASTIITVCIVPLLFHILGYQKMPLKCHRGVWTSEYGMNLLSMRVSRVFTSFSNLYPLQSFAISYMIESLI